MVLEVIGTPEFGDLDGQVNTFGLQELRESLTVPDCRSWNERARARCSATRRQSRHPCVRCYCCAQGYHLLVNILPRKTSHQSQRFSFMCNNTDLPHCREANALIQQDPKMTLTLQ